MGEVIESIIAGFLGRSRSPPPSCAGAMSGPSSLTPFFPEGRPPGRTLRKCLSGAPALKWRESTTCGFATATDTESGTELFARDCVQRARGWQQHRVGLFAPRCGRLVVDLGVKIVCRKGMLCHVISDGNMHGPGVCISGTGSLTYRTRER